MSKSITHSDSVKHKPALDRKCNSILIIYSNTMCNKNICCENINICVQPTHAWGSSSVITAGVSTTGWCVTMLTLVGTIQMRCMAVSSTQVCRKSSSCKILMIASLCGRGGWGCSHSSARTIKFAHVEWEGSVCSHFPTPSAYCHTWTGAVLHATPAAALQLQGF